MKIRAASGSTIGRAPSAGRRWALYVCIAAGTTATPARAQSTEAGFFNRVGGALAVTNDYVYRGVSLSDGGVSFQGSVHSGLGAHFNLGLFAASVHNARSDSTEAEISGSISGVWRPATDWTVRGAWSHFYYSGEPSPLSYDYDEFSVSAAFRSYAVLSVSWMPNAQGFTYTSGRRREEAGAVDLTGSMPLFDGWSLGAGAGYYDVSKLYGTGYAYWHAGVTGLVGPIEIDVLYIGSDHHADDFYGGEATGTRWSAALRWRF